MKFTKHQQDHIDWAIDAMDDPEMYPDGPVRDLEHAFQIDAIDDLLYRLEEQLPDMADQDPEAGNPVAAQRAADKIRDEWEKRNGEPIKTGF